MGLLFPEQFKPLLPAKPKIFVSYQHSSDQSWYDRFSFLFCEQYDLATDNSLDRRIGSKDPEYVIRRIREEYLTGTSLTIILCGLMTWKRRYVDWETYATLEKGHALLGIVLPTSIPLLAPDRLNDNVQSQYAHITNWSENPQNIATAILLAKLCAYNKTLIRNDREKMQWNRS